MTLTDITIPLWSFITLIATNLIVWAVALLIGELICYFHDMIKVEIQYRKALKRLKNIDKERKK